MRTLLLIALALFALGAATVQAAPPLRPYAGVGVLRLHPVPGAEKGPLPIYAKPGIERLAELEIGALPRLEGDRQEPLVAVSATRGSWVRIAYDDAGREGWIETSRSWEYRPWEDFLPGRTVRVLPGIKKGLYTLREEPREAGRERGALTRDQQVQVIRVIDDWARIRNPAGWFRWRDGDGRLTVAP